MEEERKTESKLSRVLINTFIVIVIVFILLYLYARYVEHSRIQMNEYRISSESIPKNFSGIKIIHFSDLYFGNTTDISEVEILVDKINIMKPDLILFTGNLYGNKIKKEKELQESLLKLESKLGKYAVKGNNDYYEEYESFMESIDFHVLKNEYDLVYNDGIIPIYICGLNSSLKEEVSFEKCDSYFENQEAELFKIYMVHESDIVKKIMSGSSANLIVSGNSLGGLINIPFYGKVFIPNGSKKYNKDYYKVDDTNAYVSNGIGTDQKPYRFLNKPSFNLYRLKSLEE